MTKLSVILSDLFCRLLCVQIGPQPKGEGEEEGREEESKRNEEEKVNCGGDTNQRDRPIDMFILSIRIGTWKEPCKLPKLPTQILELAVST